MQKTHILSSPVSTSVVTTVTEEVISSANDVSDVSSYVETEPSSRQTEKTSDSIVQSPTNQEDTTTICDTKHIFTETPVESIQSTIVEHKPKNKNVEINSQTNHLVPDVTNETAEISSNALTDHEVLIKPIENDDSTSANAKHELFESNSNDTNVTDILNDHIGYPGEGLTNGERYLKHFNEKTNLTEKKSKLTNSQESVSNTNSTTMEVNEEQEEIRQLHYNNSSIVRTSFVLPKKYSKKGSKFVREPTPGPDLDMENGKLIQQFEAVELLDDSCAVTNNKLNETDQKAKANEKIALVEMRGNENNKTKTTSQITIEASNEDFGFESQTRISEYPITAAVKEWLRRANSPDLFVTSASTSESETDEDEEMDAKPPKNLQGNPMPALSANSSVDNVTLSRMASCGEFAKTNSQNNMKNNQLEDDSTLISIGRRKRDAKGTKRKGKAKKIDKRNRNVDEKTQNQLVSSLISCTRLEDLVAAVRLRKDTSKNNVGNVCEFTQEDSVAGMRVALSSRINSKRVNAGRIKTLRKVNGNHIENIDIKMRRIDVSNDEKKSNEYGMVSVRTFEKGEIIVSKDGKLLPMSLYEAVPSLNDQDNNPSAMKTAAHVDVINENVVMREEIKNSSENEENNSIMIASSVSIEEPDVLECWEAETIEPVITPRRMMQSPGVLYEGEAAEEDNFEIERTTMEHVQKYYKLEQNSIISVEDESSEEGFSTSVISSKLKTVPNNSEKTIEHFCSEEIPIFVPNRSQAVVSVDEKIPVDEAFEVYESCYTEKSSFLPFDSKMFKQQPLYGQNSEGPIPCRAVCCNIQ